MELYNLLISCNNKCQKLEDQFIFRRLQLHTNFVIWGLSHGQMSSNSTICLLLTITQIKI
jgi:hypothetical protein